MNTKCVGCCTGPFETKDYGKLGIFIPFCCKCSVVALTDEKLAKVFYDKKGWITGWCVEWEMLGIYPDHPVHNWPPEVNKWTVGYLLAHAAG